MRVFMQARRRKGEKDSKKKRGNRNNCTHTKKKTKSCSACTSKPGSAGHTAGKTPEEEKKHQRREV